MFNAMLDATRRFRQRLTALDDQPLSRTALVVIVFLDVFILVSIFDGLAAHTAQLARPDERIPPLCRSLVVDGEWNASNRLDALARLVTNHHAREFDPTPPDAAHRHPVCAPILSAYEAVRDDPALASDLRAFVRVRNETHELRTELDRAKGAYDTRLLEGMAGRAPRETEAGALERSVAETTATLDAHIAREAQLTASLSNDARVQALFVAVGGVPDADREALAAELRRLNFWYPAQRLGMEMLFLLPLVAAFWFWNTRSVARGRPFQTLVSSHLSVVVMIPVVLKLLELVYDIIPRRFLQQFIEVLAALKLVALWHYLMIGLAVVAALALVYVLQKKLFSHARLVQRRIAKGQCQACGERLPPESRHCPACGAAQFRNCSVCHAPTHLHGRYCIACGADAQQG